eukprot:6188074-Pleurochrysis_carterae.AAC.1
MEGGGGAGDTEARRGVTGGLGGGGDLLQSQSGGQLSRGLKAIYALHRWLSRLWWLRNAFPWRRLIGWTAWPTLRVGRMLPKAAILQTTARTTP